MFRWLHPMRELQAKLVRALCEIGPEEQDFVSIFVSLSQRVGADEEPVYRDGELLPRKPNLLILE